MIEFASPSATSALAMKPTEEGIKPIEEAISTATTNVIENPKITPDIQLQRDHGEVTNTEMRSKIFYSTPSYFGIYALKFVYQHQPTECTMFGNKTFIAKQIHELQLNLSKATDELNAITKNIGYIQFSPKGDILGANSLFLDTAGYSEKELVGQHHRIFCDNSYSQSNDYSKFWNDLSKGIAKSGTFKRFTKHGQLIYLEATYFPVKDHENRVVKVIKIASDVTRDQLKLAEKMQLSTPFIGLLQLSSSTQMAKF